MEQGATWEDLKKGPYDRWAKTDRSLTGEKNGLERSNLKRPAVRISLVTRAKEARARGI